MRAHKERIFAHILKQRVRFFEQYSSDDLNMRVNMGASSIGTILNQVILNGARDGVTVIALLAVMAGQDMSLTLICLVAVPFVFFGIARLLKHIKELMQQEMLSVIELNKHVREAVQGIKVIKAYNLEPVITSEVNAVIDSIKDRSNRVSALQTAPIPIIDTLGGVGIALAILYAGYRSVYEAYDPGTFLSFVTALLLGLDPARRLSQLRVSLKTSVVAVGMINKLLNDNDPEMHTPAAPEALPHSEPSRGLAIAMHNVRFGYNKHSDVLKHFTLDIRPGETVAFVGPSGAGKSTIFSLLLQFHCQQSGQILIGGKAVEGISVAELRNLISYVGQSNFIFSGTIRENLTLRNARVTQEALDDACKAVGLNSYIDSLPKGYNTDTGELGSQISGGQAQRFNIVRAILKDAPFYCSMR